MMNAPISLYRFLDSDAALKTLTAGKFRVGRVSDFNDPFEWRLGFKGISSQPEQQVADKIAGEHLPWFDSRIGILCFSGEDSVSKPVLWSLYADKHRGVAFEIKYPWPKDHLHEMTYTEERPVLDFNLWRTILDGRKKEEHLLSLIDGLRKRKSSGWSFENEYRIFIDLNDSNNTMSSDGRYHWTIPRTALPRVILGFRCTLQEDVVKKLLEMNGFMETKVVRATMCRESYTVRH